MVYYGLACPEHVWLYARRVCDVLGNGANATAINMLVETAAQETHGGRYRDPTAKAGRGLCQIDLIGFKDVQARTRDDNAQAVLEAFNVDVRTVQHCELDHSPMLSMIFCRLFYILIPDLFPRDVVGRAHYWKRFYNTRLGHGTPQKYVENAKRYAS